MVVALGPGKFYGSSLPRPRIYTDVRFSDERVDPPASVTDPLMCWAEEAHWSMGGLSCKRLRLQGRIEGSVQKLRAEREKSFKKSLKGKIAKKSVIGSPSTPQAPVAVKRKRMMRLLDEEEEEEEEEEPRAVEKRKKVGRKTARKLGDDFDRVADEQRSNPMRGGVGAAVLAAARKQSPRTEEEEVEKAKGKKGKEAAKARSSPRLSKKK